MAAPDPDEPVRLVIDGDALVVRIPDSKGEMLAYLVEPAPPGLDDWAVRLTRLDGAAGPYRVRRSPGGFWRCDCADAAHRAKREARRCKHALHVSRVYRQLLRLMPRPTPSS